MKELHDAIMNIPCKRKDSEFLSPQDRIIYKHGHRDARHAAAELALQMSTSALPSPAPDSVMTAEQARAALLAMPLDEVTKLVQGQQPSPERNDMTTVTCPTCNGSGHIDNGHKAIGCDDCDGQGRIIVSRSDMLDAERVYFVRYAGQDGWKEASKEAYWLFSEANRRILYAPQGTPTGMAESAEIERLKAGWAEAFKLAIEWQGRALRAEELLAESAPECVAPKAFAYVGELVREELAERATAGTRPDSEADAWAVVEDGKIVETSRLKATCESWLFYAGASREVVPLYRASAGTKPKEK